MSNKYDAFGTQLQIGSGTGGGAETFATIGGIRTIDGPGGDTEVRDATSHDSPARARQKRAGLTDYGDVSGELLYDPADTTHKLMLSLQAAGTMRNFKIIDVDTGASVTTFRGFVRTFRPTRPYNDMLGARFAIEVVEAPTFPV